MGALFVLCFFFLNQLGIFPTDEHVSWEGHLFGFLMGGLISYVYCMSTEAREQIDRVADEITIGGSTDGERQSLFGSNGEGSSGGSGSTGRRLDDDEV